MDFVYSPFGPITEADFTEKDSFELKDAIIQTESISESRLEDLMMGKGYQIIRRATVFKKTTSDIIEKYFINYGPSSNLYSIGNSEGKEIKKGEGACSLEEFIEAIKKLHK
jgi:hypothetical protein